MTIDQIRRRATKIADDVERVAVNLRISATCESMGTAKNDLIFALSALAALEDAIREYEQNRG